MRIVLALGGNALLRRGERASAPNQQRNVETAATAIAAVAEEHEVILTHGNGPQVGLLALQNEAFAEVPPYPLDVLGAESEGMVGHMLELALRNALPERDVVSVLTEVVVAGDDPAFRRPTKPIGPVYGAEQAQRLRLDRGWTVGRDGDGYRRLVPSPEPHAIAEIRSLRVLVDSGALVICAGGGGIPIALDGLGTMHGVEAVVDKDLTAALLARRLDADLLVLLTDVDAVRAGWGGPDERPIHEAQPQELRQLDLAAGSMAPKAEAACRFAARTGRRAAIGALTDVARVVRGEAGTQVRDPAAEPALAASRQPPRR
ncbi:MAG TPA: carbamate kinase [Solirubrobacterales bacterium]|nr:carbamate kinase [Solirubrobacterales bacterium]